MAEFAVQNLKVVEFYAGIGGFHYALLESGIAGEVIASVDINTNTSKVYSHNFPLTPQLNRNICGLTAKELDGLGADVFFLSPPCQPFTRQGKKLDNKDSRTDSFFHLMHTLEEMRSPPNYLLMENVKGFESSQTRTEFVGILKSLKYDVREFLLSPNQFGIPNSRLRFYLLARRKPLQFSSLTSARETSSKPSEDAEELIRFVSSNISPNPAHGNNLEPVSCNGKSPIPEPESEIRSGKGVEGANDNTEQNSRTCLPLSNYLENVDRDLLGRYLVPDKILQRCAVALDIVQSSSQHSCCFTKAYGNYAVGTGSVLQHSQDESALKRAFEKLTEHRDGDSPERSVEALRGLDLRYFTPREVANLMCFPKEFRFPPALTDRQCYKCLGNSLNVRVVGMLIKYLIVS